MWIQPEFYEMAPIFYTNRFVYIVIIINFVATFRGMSY